MSAGVLDEDYKIPWLTFGFGTEGRSRKKLHLDEMDGEYSGAQDVISFIQSHEPEEKN